VRRCRDVDTGGEATGEWHREPPAAAKNLPPTTAARSCLQVVLLELCAERRPVLTADKLRQPSLSEVMTEIRTGRTSPFQGIYSW
jgi:hypothetical protein